MNKQELVDLISRRGLCETKIKAEEIVELIFNEIKNAVKDGKKVSIAGFGIFIKKQMNARKARNPRTGETVTVPKHGKVRFKISENFKNLVK